MNNISLKTQVSDDNCANWQKENFNKYLVARTVARCVYNKLKGKHFCELKSKEDRTCPIYWNVKTKKYENNLAETSRSSIPATDGHLEFPCDELSGLTCQFDTEPYLLWGIPLLKGRGVCKPVSK